MLPMVQNGALNISATLSISVRATHFVYFRQILCITDHSPPLILILKCPLQFFICSAGSSIEKWRARKMTTSEFLSSKCLRIRQEFIMMHHHCSIIIEALPKVHVQIDYT
jgi:hypothetical protein